MNFGQALEEARKGNKIARKGWNGQDMWLMFVGSSVVPSEHARGGAVAEQAKESDPVFIEPHLDFKTSENKISVGWRPTSLDMFSNDWEIVNFYA